MLENDGELFWKKGEGLSLIVKKVHLGEEGVRGTGEGIISSMDTFFNVWIPDPCTYLGASSRWG